MKASSVLHCPVLTGSLFQWVAAPFPKPCHRTSHQVFLVRLEMLAFQISGILSDDKQQQVTLITEGQSHVGFYTHKFRSYVEFCVLQTFHRCTSETMWENAAIEATKCYKSMYQCLASICRNELADMSSIMI